MRIAFKMIMRHEAFGKKVPRPVDKTIELKISRLCMHKKKKKEQSCFLIFITVALKSFSGSIIQNSKLVVLGKDGFFKSRVFFFFKPSLKIENLLKFSVNFSEED